MNIVETRALTKTYGRKRAVSGMNLHVQRGDIYGFVGKNGAGKSTAMKMIAGLVQPTEGEIILFGNAPATPCHPERSGAAAQPKDLRAPSSAFRASAKASAETLAGASAATSARIGALIEAPGLLPNLSAYENLMVKALAQGVVDAPARCRETLSLVGLSATGRKRVKGFSLGMKQRLGLALALIGSPDLLLLDEPLNGLDPEATRSIRNLLVRLNQAFGITIIISSHVLDQLDRVATRYGVIADGVLVRELTAAQVQAECSESLRVRTLRPETALVLLQERFPQVTFRALPDGALVLTGPFDAQAVSKALHDADHTVVEFSTMRRDLEEYFVELMDGGAKEGVRHV